MKVRTKFTLQSIGAITVGLIGLFVLFELIPFDIYREYEQEYRDADGVRVVSVHYWHLHRVGWWHRYDVGNVYEARWVNGKRIDGRHKDLVARFP